MTATRAMLVVALVFCVRGGSAWAADGGPASDEECFRRAAQSAPIAGYSLSKVQRWLREVALKQIDPETGLYRADGNWNYRDTAADCYPFLCWAAWAVDKEALDGPVRNVLHVEQELCNHVDRIPVPWDFDKKAKVQEHPYDALIFEASEYVKDGLIAIVEVTGKDEWFERMKAIEEDIWKHARVDTPYGKIPSTNIEVNGDHLQALARLYTMTGEAKFLTWAERLADYYLKPGNFVPTRLRDHGCEIIGGLGLLLGVESEVNPDKAREYLPAIRHMLDEILARGLNPDGLMVNTLANEPGRRDERLSDGWGYNYVGYLCHDVVAGKPFFRETIIETFKTLASNPKYTDYNWEGNHSIDGYADSLEGAIYLLNRIAVPEGLVWVDREMANNVARLNEPLDTAKLWGTMKLESNGVRTVLQHALMHTRGLIARPWRRDLELGACEANGKLYVVVKGGKDWAGQLAFDVPRHRLYMGFQHDWPRMNTLPEWFTVEPEGRYRVRDVDADAANAHSGDSLAKGLDVKVEARRTLRLIVEPEP